MTSKQAVMEIWLKLEIIKYYAFNVDYYKLIVTIEQL